MSPDDRTCNEVKALYLEGLHRIIATKPKQNVRGIRRIIDHTQTHPIGFINPTGTAHGSGQTCICGTATSSSTARGRSWTPNTWARR